MTDALRSPRLDSLLARLRRGLVRGVLLHGVGTAIAATAGWLLAAALLDYFLHLPLPIRIFHGLVTVVLPLYLLRRELLRPLRRVPDRAGLAVLLDRAHPGGHDLLVSAVQLPARCADTPARPLAERVVARAEERAAHLSPGGVLDRRGPRRRALLATVGVAAAAGLAVARPDLSGIFLARTLGGDVAWPRRTHLTVEVPVAGDRVQVEEREGEIVVRAARGADLPLMVRAEGVVPREVHLHFASGHRASVQSGGGRLFRTRLRSVQEDLEFHVTGGDDRRGLPVVKVTVLQPPDVGGIAWSVTPPEYSGLDPFVSHAPDVEVLEGSEVTVHLAPDPPEAYGVARLFPQDEEVALEPRPFPPAEADGTPLDGLAFDFRAVLSMRVSFELTDATGLPNPDPGLFALSVVEDRRPEVLLLAPGRADLDVVLGGAVPLRVRVEDDFGIEALQWDVRDATHPDEPLAAGPLERRPAPGNDARLSSARVVEVARTVLDVDELAGEEPLQEGSRLDLQVLADDVREPAPNQTPSAAVRLRVVSGDEFLRNLQDQLARASESARRVYELADEHARLSRDLASADGGEEPDEPLGDLSPMLHGLRRVQGDARALARDLAHVAEGLLYSRLDPRGASLLAALDAAQATSFDRSFQPGPWRDVAERYRGGQLGQADLAGTLVEIVGLALDASEEHLVEASDAMTAAVEADGAAAKEPLDRSVRAQARAREVLDELLVKLGEWDNFQSVLTLTRDILNRQKNLIQRTRKLAEDEDPDEEQ